ncbi:MAG: Tn3 family transposase [Flammeovirgaceae bacterium]|nr:Tn3 family transposase [Flammeovirgaceae bacterium]
MLKKFRSPYSKVGFILRFGYFHHSRKIFGIPQCHASDVEKVKQLLEYNTVNLDKYSRSLSSHHRKLIFEMTRTLPFEKMEATLMEECSRLAGKQLQPRQIFHRLMELLLFKNAEIPSVNRLTTMISEGFTQFEEGLIAILEQHLSLEDQQLLDEVLEEKEGFFWELTGLKTPNQSLRRYQIKQTLAVFEQIKTLYHQLMPIYTRIDTSKTMFKQYAVWTTKARTYQLQRLANPYKKWLYLLSFLHYQYCIRQDYLIDILLQSVQYTLSKAERMEQYHYYQQRKTHQKNMQYLSDRHNGLLAVHQAIKSVINTQKLSANQKIDQVALLLQKSEENGMSSGVDIEEPDEQETYLQSLQTQCRRLSGRVSELLKSLTFNPDTSSSILLEALAYFTQKKTIGKKAPTGFVPKTLYPYLFNDKGNIMPTRYKLVLFIQVAQAIKAGKLNLLDSYKYLSVEEYMLAEAFWKKNKSQLLQQVGLLDFQDGAEVLAKLEKRLNDFYQNTNERILNGQNPHFKTDKKGRGFVTTPAVEKKKVQPVYELIQPFVPHKIPLIEILMNAEKFSGFLESFQHLGLKWNPSRPDKKVFYAILMGYGCNLGIEQLTQSITAADTATIINVVQWYFSSQNIQEANNKVLEAIAQLDLPNLLIQDTDLLKTASDGQKYPVTANNQTLNAARSFKYMGAGKGLSIYSFIDERNMVFHSNVISMADRESLYVVDGLVNDQVVKSKMHMTDTEGFTEVIFAVTHLMGIQFAPRIKNYKKQILYTFKPKEKYKDQYQQKAYPLLPIKYINTEVILDNWDNILRFVTSILTREVLPSQLFKRLNSYSKQHELYTAIREYGKIIKSIEALNYYDDLHHRQNIEYSLNRMELSQKFSKAVFFANNQEIEYETVEEQNIATGCKQLIQNSIVLWNYMCLTHLLLQTSDKEKKEEIIEAIKQGTVFTWRHINFYGEYDFSKIDRPIESIFKMDEIKKFKL